MSGDARLEDLADISAERRLTPEELEEVFDLSVGRWTVGEVEEWLGKEGEGS